MSLQSLIAAGTKVWLDSIDPELVRSNRKLGANGATSNPIIISDLIKTGRFDEQMSKLINPATATTSPIACDSSGTHCEPRDRDLTVLRTANPLVALHIAHSSSHVRTVGFPPPRHRPRRHERPQGRAACRRSQEEASFGASRLRVRDERDVHIATHNSAREVSRGRALRPDRAQAMIALREIREEEWVLPGPGCRQSHGAIWLSTVPVRGTVDNQLRGQRPLRRPGGSLAGSSGQRCFG